MNLKRWELGKVFRPREEQGANSRRLNGENRCSLIWWEGTGYGRK